MTTDSSAFDKYFMEYLSRHNDVIEFKSKCNAQMQAYEQAETEARNKHLSQANEADEDGFYTVVSSKPKVFGDKEDSADTPANINEISTAPGFYRKDQKSLAAKELTELKRKFEQDKRQLEELRKNKIFRS